MPVFKDHVVVTVRSFLFSLYCVMMAFFCSLSTAHAGLWAEVGDKQLREDIELLHDVGLVHGPTLSWPLPWEQISEDVTEAAQSPLISPFLRDAAARVLARMRPINGLKPNVELTLRATNGAPLVRDFADASRSDADGRLRIEHSFDHTTLVYGVGYQDSQTFRSIDYGGKATFDNVYLAQEIDNWLFYIGTVEQWWGPSGEQSLFVSNSARPYPKIGFKRAGTDPFESSWLRWIGFWRFEANLGVLDGPRADYQNVFLLSQRFEFEPLPHLQIAASRFSQICGKDNPQGLPNRRCGTSIFLKALALTGSANSGILSTDSSNSGAAIDLRYGRPIGNITMVFNAQAFAEDSPFNAISYNAGIAFSGHTPRLGLWKIGAEVADTYATRILQGNLNGRQPSTTYLNFVYSDGFSYRGQPIAFSLDGDSKLYSIFGSVIDSRNRRWSAALRYADVNITSTPNYHISTTREKIVYGSLGLNLPTRWGDGDIKMRAQSDSPNTPGRRVPRVQIEGGWTFRFF